MVVGSVGSDGRSGFMSVVSRSSLGGLLLLPAGLAMLDVDGVALPTLMTHFIDITVAVPTP